MMEVPYHYQFRVIVIGDTMVGKSSLLKTFSDGTFEEMEPTVGVDFFSKIIEIKPKHYANLEPNSSSHNRQEESIIIKLQIWDTAGQERFKSIVTSYYRNSVGIILVYDVTNRESYDHLIDWFTEASAHVEPAPSPSLTPINQNQPTINPKRYHRSSTPAVSPMKLNYSDIDSSSLSFNSQANLDFSNLSFNSMSDHHFNRQSNENYKMAYLVLGCKTDLESQRQVSYEDGRAFADTYGLKFIETSSRKNFNVNQAFQLLAEEIYEKIAECGRLNRLHRTASGGHLTFDGSTTHVNEGIRLGPLIENNIRHYSDANGLRLLEAQPVSGFMGGCC